ncbi:FlgO family outer membrane protein [Gemmatimonas sp.]|uniref:FlgO family outer membrane protein n=1 Tax=Gemmatimonas sp. TaxID=1962908 RepID=UPI0039839781
MTDLRTQLQTTLGPGYTLERELGGGGMSRVFVAHEHALGREVVVKVLSPELAAGVSADRFAREIKLAAALQEPHIVPVLVAGATREGLPYYTMPYVRGDSLRARLLNGPVALGDALGILRNIAQALAYAHERGIVHRDIKPENVLLSSGTAVVTDFGIAKALSASSTHAPGDTPGDTPGNTLTSVGTSIGTPAYMAPEQAVGDENTDARADLYAWGVVAYELLAGAHPFAHCTSPQSLVTAHITETPRALSDVQPTIPRDVSAIVMQCLAKDPLQRPANAHAVLERLSTVTTPSAEQTHRRLIRSHRLAFVVPVIVALIAAIGWWATRDRAPTSPSATGSVSSIAVLPFADISPDRRSGYLGDGVAETLINALSQVPGLTVSARTSAFSFRDQQNDLRAIGKQLGVSAVLTGSIQRAGDQLRITARAVRIANDSILWSQSFDRPASDIFAVQDEVARAVVSALRLTLAAVPDSTRNVGGTTNIAAYEAYALGRYHWNLRTTEGMIQATAAFKKSIAADSTYARAWSGLADAYVLSVPGEYNVPGVTADSILPLAEAAAQRAISLAPTLGEAYASLGEVLDQSNRIQESLSAFERGLALSPAYATGHQWYSYVLMSSGRWDEGIREMEAAHRLDPLAHVITLSLAFAYDGADRFTDASLLYAQGLAQQPQSWYAWRLRFSHDLALKRFDDAAEALLMSLKDPATDKYDIVARFAPRWRDPATRDAATDSLIASGPAFASIALSRWIRSDSVVLAVMRRIPGDPKEVEVRSAWGAMTLLGPRLRADPRFRPTLRALGFPFGIERK